jgi:NADH-quinone oxidoreductase subunit C
MAGDDFLSKLNKKFGSKITGANTAAIDPWIEIAPDAIVEVCTYLRDTEPFCFEMLNCLTVVDYCEPDPKKAAKLSWEPHLELVYHLSSISKKHTLVLKVQLPRWKDDIEGELPEIASVAGVWRTADWHEREVYDLSGVRFLGHPNLRRILCPEDWVGHPLRKDYEMPLEYHGIRGR